MNPSLELPPNLECRHHYGERVHLMGGAWLCSALARIGSPSIGQTELLALVRSVYHHMTVVACSAELALVHTSVETRMAEAHPREGVWSGECFDPSARVVIADVVRGGIVPSQTCFEMLCMLLNQDSVRLDHLSMARLADGEGRVCGVDLSGSKIGGTVEGATLIVPDPMGATGSTALRLIEHYREGFGSPRRIVLMPMIATPEFLRAVLDADEDVVVYAGRIDRGLSNSDVLEAEPGLHWEQERGLNDHGYIVPGAGGVGEVLNNSWC